jgi:hypothetical protein
MRHRRGGEGSYAYTLRVRKILRLLITILHLLTATHLMYLNDTLYLLRLAPISAVEAEGTLLKIFFLGCLQGILKNACQIPTRYHRKQQKILLDNEVSTTGFTKIQPILESN